jgi:hypothetical protein
VRPPPTANCQGLAGFACMALIPTTCNPSSHGSFDASDDGHGWLNRAR